MGQEISTSNFTGKDFDSFREKLRNETNRLNAWFESGKSTTAPRLIGMELETWLVDDSYIPSPHNHKFLQTIQNPLVVPELSRFNAEINAPPASLESKCFNKVYNSLKNIWTDVQQASDKLGLKMLMIGTPPTLEDKMLSPETMTRLERYKAINEQIMRLRRGRPIHLKIDGTDHLESIHSDIMLEAAATSLQIHLQVPHEELVPYFNASLIASAPIVAITANSPLMFGKNLWAESRIPVFEQALQLPGYRDNYGNYIERVTFGSGYVRESFREVFMENIVGFPPLLPLKLNDPVESYAHLRLHNGTIWRWNRPILGLDENGEPHLRIEHRTPAAGPTLIDIAGNMMFYIGLTAGIIKKFADPKNVLPFHLVKKNFYNAARHGLNAQMVWPGFGETDFLTIFEKEILPLTYEGLNHFSICSEDITNIFERTIPGRLHKRQNGATWQIKFLEKNSHDLQKLTRRYFEYQESNTPVCDWALK